MSSLPRKLRGIEGIGHALYSDDLTIWTTGGSAGQQEDALQEAVDTTEEYIKCCGLSCAPEKSELLVLRKRTRGRPPKERPQNYHRRSRGTSSERATHPRPCHTKRRSWGSGAAEGTKDRDAVGPLIRRVANRRHGLKEEDCVQMIQALLISRLTYGTPYVDMQNAEKNKANVAIRKAFKLAIGLPPTTSTEQLLQMGVHNTWKELVEAKRVNQFRRLTLTTTGRALLEKLGYPVELGVHYCNRLSRVLQKISER